MRSGGRTRLMQLYALPGPAVQLGHVPCAHTCPCQHALPAMPAMHNPAMPWHAIGDIDSGSLQHPGKTQVGACLATTSD